MKQTQPSSPRPPGTSDSGGKPLPYSLLAAGGKVRLSLCIHNTTNSPLIHFLQSV